MTTRVVVMVRATNASGNGTGNLTFNIIKGSQAIGGVEPNMVRSVGSGTYSLNASVTSNLTLTCTSSNTSVATVAVNGLVTVKSVGTTTVTVSQAGNANYNAATSVRQVLTVKPAVPVVTGATINGTVGRALSANITAANLPTSYAVTTGILPSGLSLNLSTGGISGTPIAAGSESVTVMAANGGGNGTGVLTFNIAKGNQSINGLTGVLTKVVGAAAYSLNATINSSLELSYESSNASVATVATNGIVTVVGVGTTTLKVSQAGDANYNAATSVTQILTVTPPAPVVTSATINGTVGSSLSVGIAATNSPTSYAVASGLLPSGLSLNGTTGVIAGTPTTAMTTRVVVMVRATNGGGNSTGNLTFNIAKSSQTIGAFETIEPKLVGVVPFLVIAPIASSALPVKVSVKSGLATISANCTLTIIGPGNVTLAANQAGNANCNSAQEVTTTFLVSRPLSTLTVNVPDVTEGSVTVGFAGATTREVGANYTVTAIPASGMISKGWRKNNTALSANATLKFVMEANMQLTPVFAPDFSKLAGLYNGLVGDGEIGSGSSADIQTFPSKNGFVTFSLSTTGAFTGNLSIEGQISGFTGNFTTNKTTSISIARSNKTAAQALIQLNPALIGEISGNITVMGSPLHFRALRAAYTIGTAAHALGNRTYTFVVPSPEGVSVGHGFGKLSIQRNGLAAATGKLATGEVISATAGVVDSGDGNWVMPVYSTGNGILTGEIVIPKSPNAGTAELAGSFEWLRSANSTSTVLPASFLTRSSVVGVRYSFVTGNSILSGNTTTAGFNLRLDPQQNVLAASISQNGSWSANNTPVFTQPISSGLLMTYSSANATVQGTFNRMMNGAPISTAFQGAIFGKPIQLKDGEPVLRGAGYFLSGNQSVPFQITSP